MLIYAFGLFIQDTRANQFILANISKAFAGLSIRPSQMGVQIASADLILHQIPSLDARAQVVDALGSYHQLLLAAPTKRSLQEHQGSISQVLQAGLLTCPWTCMRIQTLWA